MTASNGDRGMILLVEDEAILRMVMTEQLTDLGYGTVEAADSQSALGVLGGDMPLILMITDVALPGMDGCSLATEARKLRPGLPVLFSTGDAGSVRGWSGYDPGSMAIMAKPFALDGLAGVMDGLGVTAATLQPD